MENRIKVVLADANENFRTMLQQTIENTGEFDVVGSAGDGAEAAMMSCGAAEPSTPIEFVSRLTEQDVTPGILLTAFSTRAEQAAQLMPVTLYCVIACSSVL